jgi:hypothetical protein
VGAGLVRDNRVCSTALSPPRAFSACSGASSVASASARTPPPSPRSEHAGRALIERRTDPANGATQLATDIALALARDARGDNLAVEVTHRREPPHWSRAGVPRVRGVE